ncbi:hypothetical protein JW710_04320 [Candidatus Dojkabacteria bacterium]|nr:hypothetical protein [Candidatus Dojkabacteria bacterium]
MAESKKTTVDIKEAFNSFFGLPDWKNRVFMLGGYGLVVFLLFIASTVMFFIPILGWLIGGLSLLIVIAGILVTSVVITGYRQDLVDAAASSRDASNVKLFSFAQERLRKGFHLCLARIVYSLPIIFGYIMIYVVMIGAIILTDSSSSDSYDNNYYDNNYYYNNDYGYYEEDTTTTEEDVASMIAFIFMWAVSIILIPIQLVVTYIIDPTLFAQYSKYQSLASLFKLKDMWGFFKRNIINYLVYFGITLGMAFAANFVVMAAYVSVILLIGVVLLPLAAAFASLVFTHVQANMLGQMVEMDSAS